MCPVLLPSEELPSKEAMQTCLDSFGARCVLLQWEESLGTHIVHARIHDDEVVVESMFEPISSTSVNLCYVYDEYLEGIRAVWTTSGRLWGEYNHWLSLMLETCIGELQGGVLVDDVDPIPDEPGRFRETITQRLEEIRFLKCLVDHYEVEQRFHPHDLELTDHFSGEQQRKLLMHIDFDYLDWDRMTRGLTEDGGYRWLKQAAFDRIQEINQQNQDNLAKAKTLGA